MKRLFYIASAALIAYGLGYISVSLFAHWYEPMFAKSDDDIGIAFVWSLGFLGACVLIGCLFGNRLYKGRADKRRAPKI